MTLVRIRTDEWYPVYEFTVSDTERFAGIDVAEETLARWRRAFADFQAAQDEMAKAGEHSDNRRADKDADGVRIVPRWPA